MVEAVTLTAIGFAQIWATNPEAFVAAQDAARYVEGQQAFRRDVETTIRGLGSLGFQAE